MTGYLALLTVFGIALVARRTDQYRDVVGVIVHHAGSVAAFIHVPGVYTLIYEPLSTLAPSHANLQRALIAIAGGALGQLLVCGRTTRLFYRILVASAVALSVSLAILPLLGGGIINLTWMVLFGAGMACLLLLNAIFSALAEVIATSQNMDSVDQRHQVLSLVRDEMNRIFGYAVQGFLALGASVGVAMTILFRDGQQAWSRNEFQMNAGRLVAGFVLLALGAAFFVVKPYLDNFARVRYYFEATTGARPRIIT